MRIILFILSGLAFCGVIGGSTQAQQPPSYARQVKPFLARYCLECHNAKEPKGDLNLETFQGLMKGGKTGSVVEPGKPDDSRLVLLAERKEKPEMPPAKARQPKPNEASLLRAWVAAGAKDDSASVTVTIPNIKPRSLLPAAVTALAYRPDGKQLAVGGHQKALLITVAGDSVIGELPGQKGQVTALAFRGDGRMLAVASGAASAAGEVRLYAMPPDGLPAAQPDQILKAHTDLIYDMTFSPDGKLLATTGYDRLIKLWEITNPGERGVLTPRLILKDHSDTVYGLAFSRDGKLLVSGAADRAVKVWDVATGIRLYTLSDPTDWVYAVACSPDGKHLAAGGVDRSIRIWEITAEGGKLVHSAFAHEGSVVRLAYAADGKTLYSLGEDRTLKAWDTAKLVELRTYPKQEEAALSLAVRPDRRQLAVGRYDGALLLLDEASGKVQAQPLPVKPKPPQLNQLTPTSGQRGTTIRVTFEGKELADAAVVASTPGVTVKVVPESRSAGKVQADVTLPLNAAAGVCQLGLKTPSGQTANLPFTIDLFAAASEKEPNNSPTTGQSITLSTTVAGALAQAGDVDCYRFDAKAGQQIGVQLLASAVGSKVEPHLQLTNATGQVVAESTNGVLGHTCLQEGSHALTVRDRDYRGGAGMHYRLHIGDIPVITAVFPLGLQRGRETEIHLEGVNLGTVRSVRMQAAADAALGTKLPVQASTPQGTPLGNATVVVGEFPEIVRPTASANMPPLIAVPGTGNGRIAIPGATETWRFTAKKGQRLIVEAEARRLGSPLDSLIEILDAQGQPVPRAVLRCQAKTYVTFRDHDSVSPNIRIEAWNELAVNDTLFTGSELLRIRALPAHPDADCIFVSVAGQRVGFLDTTPTHHSMGAPMYKVSLHPPGSTFAPNGFPVFTLVYRNDDGGPGYGKDSRLFFDPPADGEYQVRIGDSRGQAGSAYAYRLTIRPPRPDFKVSFAPTAPSVWRGGAVPITVTVERLDGFEGQIDLREENVPAGFSAPLTNILPGENSTVFALWADPTAKNPTAGKPLKLVARATIDGKEVVREATGAVPKVVDPGDIVCATEQTEVAIKPGGISRLTVKIERRGDFKGRVPLEVRGLPHGVRVLDIGLNGILITEKETSRTIQIYAEPWVQPTEHPIVVLARREGKNTEHAAKSVLLKVEGRAPGTR